MCFVIKYAKDTRYSKDDVASHDKVTLRAKAAVSALSAIGDEWRDYEVIAVDEGQFFADLVPFCRTASDAGKTVIVSALDGDYLRKPFGHVCELVPLCETVTKLTAVCMMCHTREASFTRRTVASSENVLIGGADMYIATCRACYNNPVPPSPARMVRVQDAIREVERATTAAAAHNATPVAKPPAASYAVTEDDVKTAMEGSSDEESSTERSPISAAPTSAAPKILEFSEEPLLKKARCESPL